MYAIEQLSFRLLWLWRYPVDATLGIIPGRPYGGVGFLWKKGLDANVSIIECEFDWLCGIKICDGKK